MADRRGWSAWRFLLGDWISRGTNELGTADARFAFTLELDGRVLARRHRSAYAATPERPAFVHEDLLFVHPDGNAWRAVYFDNEGHVIDYRVEVADGRIVFVSEARPGAPAFRLMYESLDDRALGVRFEMMPPGTDAFTTYVSGVAERAP